MAGAAGTRASMWRKRVRPSALVLFSAATFVAGCWLSIAPAQAQIMSFPRRPAVATPKPSSITPQGDKTPMLLQAIEIHYDTNNKRVSAVGNV